MLTNRERFLNIMAGKPADRMCAVHFGYWRELLHEWADQGHIPRIMAKLHLDGTLIDRKLDKLLGWDFCFTPRGGAISMLFPPFRVKILRYADGGKYYINRDGVTIFRKRGAQGKPAEIDYLLKDRASYEKYYKPKFKYHKWRNFGTGIIYMRAKSKDYPIGYDVGSAIGTIRNICTVIGMSYLMHDDYDLFKEIVDDYNNMQYQCLKTTLQRGCKYDFLHYWEDICFKNGPLIAPDMFYDLCYPHYKRVSELAKEYGINYISVDCDGDITKLANIWEKAGVNIMFPIEFGTWGGDISKIRQVAPTLYGVGGMNKNVLSKDKNEVDREIERLKGLVKLGGYIPCPDHRLPPGTKFELVKYYTSEIKKIL